MKSPVTKKWPLWLALGVFAIYFLMVEMIHSNPGTGSAGIGNAVIRTTEAIIRAIVIPLGLSGLAIFGWMKVKLSIQISKGNKMFLYTILGVFILQTILCVFILLAINFATSFSLPLAKDLLVSEKIGIWTEVNEITKGRGKYRYTGIIPAKISFSEMPETQFDCFMAPHWIQKGQRVQVVILPNSKTITLIEQYPKPK